MNLELATRILEAFGPCTGQYECTTPEELVEDFEDGRISGESWDLVAYLQHLIAVEERFQDSSLAEEHKDRILACGCN